MLVTECLDHHLHKIELKSKSFHNESVWLRKLFLREKKREKKKNFSVLVCIGTYNTFWRSSKRWACKYWNSWFLALSKQSARVRKILVNTKHHQRGVIARVLSKSPREERKSSLLSSLMAVWMFMSVVGRPARETNKMWPQFVFHIHIKNVLASWWNEDEKKLRWTPFWDSAKEDAQISTKNWICEQARPKQQSSGERTKCFTFQRLG